MTRKRRISGAAVVALLLLPLTLPASASPADDARSRATAIARQRQQITVEAERVNERRLATVLELDQLNRNAEEMQVKLAVTDQSMQNLSGQAKDAAIQAYVTGADSSGIASVVQATNANEIPVREGYTGALLSSAQDVVDQIRSARQDTQQAGRQLKALIDQKTTLQASLDADQVRLTKAEAQLADLAKRTDAEIVTLVQQEQERLAQEAAEKAAAKALIATPPAVTAVSAAVLSAKAAPVVAPVAGARVPSAPKPSATVTAAPTTKPTTPPTTKPTTPPTSKAPSKPAAKPATPSAAPVAAAVPVPVPAAKPNPTTTQADQPAPDGDAQPTAPDTAPPTTQAPRQNYPAPTAGAATAVAEALRQLGKPYVFGAAGPDSFDCSGLTQWAWGKAGVSMDHYTGAQWNAFPHVPLDQIQPGDLVFLRVDLGHMGMYIGGGEFIHAPHTGDVVRIAKISSARIAGVVRPG
jgi:peptidoglycan DL-endopeptidase CwlO